jgi:hypothetical protein
VVAVAAKVILDRPDSHYVQARTMVSDYERGKSVEQRNYGNSVYQTALGELALVDPDSKSAVPARQLEEEIRDGIRDFESRQALSRERLQLNREEHQRVKAQIQANTARERANPQTYYPECEDEEPKEEDPSGS